MRLIALARDRYEDYFRRGLLEQAICEGVDVLIIGFRRSILEEQVSDTTEEEVAELSQQEVETALDKELKDILG